MLSAEETLNAAIRLHESGDLAAAEVQYRGLIASSPLDARAWRLLGILLCQRGELDEGIQALRHAVSISPNSPACCNSLGEALRAAGRLEEARACFERTLALDPRHVQGCFNLGSALLECGPFEQAAEYLRQALQARPNWSDAQHNLGFVLAKLDRRNEAIAAYRNALDSRPNSVDTQNNLGAVLFDQGAGDIDAAIECYRTALRLKPDHRNGLLNLGNALATIGQITEAIELFTKLIDLEPEHANAHFNRAVLRLKQGSFAEGWPEYEWRTTQSGAPQRLFNVPRWDGAPLNGRTILLHAEQGLGDTLQFVRYATLVRQRGGRVIVECQPALRQLLASVPGIDELIARGDRLPQYDLESPLMSLPGIFRTTLDTVPGGVPYLNADQDRYARWQDEVRRDGARLCIGIAWQGSSTHPDDRFRSLRLSEFEPLAKIDGVRLYALQKGEGAEQVDEFRRQWPLVDLRSRLDIDAPFVDTAALMQCVDLVVTPDTSIAHLAGALGRPVWVALQTDCDYRWMLERSDSPWYPSLRLFRQRERGHWGQVFTDMAAAARQLIR